MTFSGGLLVAPPPTRSLTHSRNVILKILQACNGFYFILKKHLKLSQENKFLAHIKRFRAYDFSRPMSYIPIFCQIKRYKEVHNRDKIY